LKISSFLNFGTNRLIFLIILLLLLYFKKISIFEFFFIDSFEI
jgi:hypothetical protein